MRSKNVQSIRSYARMLELTAELQDLNFDVLMVSETWREEIREDFSIDGGHRCCFSGGAPDGRKGVGFVIHRRFMAQCGKLAFQALSPRLAVLDADVGRGRWRFVSVYLPTGDSAEVWSEREAAYVVLSDLVVQARAEGRYIVLGGDFNASVGALRPWERPSKLGRFGVGERTASGDALVDFVLEQDLIVANRQFARRPEERWTCRAPCGTLSQIDFILVGSLLSICDGGSRADVGLGLDHQCVFASIQAPPRQRYATPRTRTMRNWQPRLDEQGESRPTTMRF